MDKNIYYSAEDMMRIFNVKHSTIVYWWKNGLPRSKQLSRKGRMKFHSSQKDLENYIGRELSQDEQKRVSAKSD